MLRASRHARCFFSAHAALILVAVQLPTASAAFKIQRVASGLDLPVHVAQAPGDLSSIYVVEEVTDDFDDGATSGQIIKVDLATGNKSSFLRVQNIYTPSEGGLHTMAFHPDFETNGKFYLTWVEHPDSGIRPQLRLDEYLVQSGVPILSKTLFDFTNLRGAAFHGINWIGFKPGATGAERDYLYFTTGDGGIQAISPNFTEESQDLSSVRGKVLRIDVSAADAYPEDPARNYGFPTSNPYADDGDDNTLGEIFHSGLRNPWRASFDRETGDLFIGDVGFNTKEEISFAKDGEAGLDFGWSKREGTVETPEAGIGGELGSSLNPIFELTHNSDKGLTNIGSITGGHVYRGPIEELQGQYIFADAQAGEVLSGTFDRSTDPADFDGNNLTDFAIRTSEFNSLIEGEGSIDTVVSFAEDVHGHLYIVDFTGGIFSDPFGQGEVYRLIPDLPADFNDDGFVNEADLAKWQTDYGQGDGSDADGDGDSDGADYLIWQRSFSSTLSAPISNATVPEPVAGGLLASALAVLAGCRIRSPKCRGVAEH